MASIPGTAQHAAPSNMTSSLKSSSVIGKVEPVEAECKTKRKNTSRSERAGLKFPVGRIHRHLKNRVRCSARIGGTAAVYCSAVMEYLAAEVLVLAGDECKKSKVKRITPRHIMVAVRTDDELDTFVKATISGSGTLPFIHPKLLRKRE